MGVKDSIRSAWKRLGADEVEARTELQRREAQRKTVALPSILSPFHAQRAMPKPTPANLRKFAETPLVRRAINIIKDRVASMDWHVRLKRHYPPDKVGYVDRKLAILRRTLEAPNDSDSFRTLIEQVLEDALVGGFGAIEMDLTEISERPFELWPVDGATIQINPKWDGTANTPRYAQATGLARGAGLIPLKDDELMYVRMNPRSSLDCENAASALMDFATDRGAAWQGKYTAWDLETQGDVWPGDVLALSSTSANMTANLVVRTVELDLSCTSPGLVKYVLSFANDWAQALAIKTSDRVPPDVWLPQQPETVTPLANLNELQITSVTSSAITVNAIATPPTNGGFEVRRKDWAFGPGTDSDLVLRSPVNNFTIPREAVMERYYIRMYDGSTPPNYSRFSTAVFVNIAM